MAFIQKIKNSTKQKGYTIVEVTIVLTVSSLLFAASVVGYTSQNRRAQFTKSVQTFAQDIQDVLNDVEVGFYPTGGGFQCRANNSGPPYFPSGLTAQQGTNEGCIFAGKAIQFAPSNDSGSASDMDIYTIVGRQFIAGSNNTEPVTSIEEASPVALDHMVERKSLVSGVEVISVNQAGGGGTYSGLAMVVNSGSAGGISTGLNSRANLAVVAGALNDSKSQFLGNSGGGGIRNITSSNINEARNGVSICLREDGPGGGRMAVIELAMDRSQIIVNTKIDEPCE